jgi:hypothetical protein
MSETRPGGLTLSQLHDLHPSSVVVSYCTQLLALMRSEWLLLKPRSISRLIQLGRSCTSQTGRACFVKPHAPLHCHPHPFPRFQEYFRRPGSHNGAVTLRTFNLKSPVPLRNEVRTGKPHNPLLSFSGRQRAPPSQAGTETNS